MGGRRWRERGRKGGLEREEELGRSRGRIEGKGVVFVPSRRFKMKEEAEGSGEKGGGGGREMEEIKDGKKGGVSERGLR